MSSSRTKTSSSSSKKSKRPRSERVETEVSPILETTPVVETVVEVPVVESSSILDEVPAIETYAEIRLQILEKELLFKGVLVSFQRLLKKLDVAHKKESKKTKKPQRSNISKKEQKKHVVVDSLAILMGEEIGYECSRREIQKFICGYIKENNLQEPDNKKCFTLDEPLREVLGDPQYTVKNKEGVEEIKHSYTNLMKILSSVFKPDVVE